ncbi:MAG: alkaline phosphatase family protein [Deltaproteobacteria bacterium]|nr:alkaline phosphatase family protein [Deltaproteobacteria bacterium]
MRRCAHGAVRAAARPLRLALLLLFGSALGCASLAPREPGSELPALDGAATPPARVVLVSMSGLTPAAYLSAPGTSGMPVLAAMASAGAAAEKVEPVVPAAAYPAHATLATGRLPAAHGVTADRLLGERGSVRRRATPRPPLRAPALWEAVSGSGRRSVVLGWPGSSGGRIDLVFPESFTLEPGEEWKSWMEAHTSPGLLEAARRLGAGEAAVARSGPERDRLLVGLACETLRSRPTPALLMLRLSQAEPPLALAGPGSPEAQAALSAEDGELGRVLTCLRDAGFADSTAVLVAGDHGALPIRSTVSPNVVLAEKGLIVPTVGGAGIQRWSAFARSNGGSAFVHAKSEQDARLARRALEAAGERTKAFRVVPARELLEKGADPEAWFGLEAASGFWIGEDVSGPLVAPAPVHGSWGHVVAGEGLAPGFVAWGRGVRSGARIPILRQSDVAPTAAVLLGFELGALDGQPIAAALSLPAVGAPPAKESAHAP